jgi:hypothetical protein
MLGAKSGKVAIDAKYATNAKAKAMMSVTNRRFQRPAASSPFESTAGGAMTVRIPANEFMPNLLQHPFYEAVVSQPRGQSRGRAAPPG